MHPYSLLFVLLFLTTNTLASPISLPLDTLLQRHYNQAAAFMAEGQYDSAQCHFDQAFALPHVQKSAIYPVLLNEQATLHVYQGDYQRGMQLKQQVIPYLPQTSNPETPISVYSDLGLLYRRQNQNDSAIYYYDKALHAAANHPDKSWMALLNMNLSVLYYNLQRMEKAESFIDQAVHYIQQADDQELYVNIHQVRANIQSALGKTDQAKASLQAAWSLATAQQDPNWQMRCLPALLEIYAQEKQKDSVYYYLSLGEKLRASLPDESINVLGFLHARLNFLFSEGAYAQVLEQMLAMKHNQTISANASFYQRLATCCYQLGQYPQAYHYMDSARIVTDSLAQAQLTQRMAELNVKYETQSKEFEISLLKQEQLEKESWWMKASIAAISLMALLTVGFLMMGYKRKLALIHLEQLRKKSELAEARKYIEGLENERKRWAKELHDGLANDLLGLEFLLGSCPPNEQLTSIQRQIQNLRKNVREISHDLMPPEFTHLSLDEILHHYTKDLAKQSGKQIDFAADPDTDWKELSHDVAYEVYRIVQESMANILKHSPTSVIEISLQRHSTPIAELKIAYPGESIQLPTTHTPGGIGLLTMHDRARAIEGKLSFHHTDGKNVCQLTFPFPKPAILSPK